MDQEDPENHIAELERQLAQQKRIAELQRQLAEKERVAPAPRSATAGVPGLPPARRWNRDSIIVAATVTPVALFLLLFAGAKEFHGYVAGIPTTATVTSCEDGNFQEGTWSIGGVSQYGPITGGFFDECQTGQSVDVHVTNGTGYTAGSWPFTFVMGGGLLAGVVLFVLRRRRTGR